MLIRDIRRNGLLPIVRDRISLKRIRDRVNKTLFASLLTEAGSDAPVTTPVLRVQDILALKPTPFTISKGTKVDAVISFMAKSNISSCLAMDKDESVAGVFTVRDIFRFVHKIGESDHGGKAAALSKPISDVMTSKEKLVYCSPSDTIRKCREIMFQMKIRNLPVIENGEVFGIITIKDLADSAFSVVDTGGKGSFTI